MYVYMYLCTYCTKQIIVLHVYIYNKMQTAGGHYEATQNRILENNYTIKKKEIKAGKLRKLNIK